MAINLEECGILREDILNGVIAQLVQNITDVEHYRIDKEVREKVSKQVDQIVEERVGALVDDLLTRPYQPLDVWGDKKGEPTSIKQLLEESLRTWWTSPVDTNGKSVPRRSYGSHSTRAEWMVAKIAKEVIDKDLSSELRKFTEQARKDIQVAMRDMITALITKQVFR